MECFSKASSSTGEEDRKQQWHIWVKSGSKLRNIISLALRLLQKEKKIMLTGTGPTVTRAITCAEIIKRKNKKLHQNNRLFYSRTEDIWEPKEDEGLDKLKVTRRIPSISITLSTVPLDPTEPGYQVPGQSKSPVQFGKEDLALAVEDDKGKRREGRGQQRRHSGAGRGHSDSNQERKQSNRSQEGHNKSRQDGRRNESEGDRDVNRKDETSGAQAKNSDHSPCSSGPTSNKRGGHHSGSRSRHSPRKKKQKGEASPASTTSRTP